MTSTQAIFEKVQKVKKTINTATTAEKNHALEEMAKQLWLSRADVLAANELDMTVAKGKISDVMLDRLYLDENRIAAMAEGIRQLIDLEDPVGEVLERTELDNDLVISKKRVAMGVIGIIYESRPNVTSDAAALALKSGSAVVLRSGKDAYQTALAIVTALKEGLAQTMISPDCIQLVSDISRASAELRLGEKAAQYISGSKARPEDFDTEFLDYVLAVKLVSSLEEAVEHIEAHSTHHSDAIVTENDAAAAYFTDQVDSAAVYVNASTRFTDGGQFGLGCEMGISTQKLHARGPMGLKELTSYKYVIQGTGQVRK